jgi:hypothetical protein
MLVLATASQAAMFDFPTDNRALLEDKPQDFYMYDSFWIKNKVS